MPSKLGPHILNSTESGRQLIKAGSQLVKFVGEFSLLPEVSPTATVIGRWYDPLTAEEQRKNEQPEAAARRYIDRQKEHYAKFPSIKLWEGHNEPVWSTREDMQWHAAFEVARLKILADLGLRGVIACFATGSPGDIELWKWFIPAVQKTKELNGVLGLHEYGSPWMWWMTGKYQMNPAEDAGEEGWTTLRYRKIMNKYLRPEGCDDVLIAITEAGLDRVLPVPNGASTGNWRTNADWWPHWNGQTDPIDYWRGPERDTEKYYAEQLIWYDKELRKNPNVLGAVVFTVGNFGAPWNEYDIAGTRVVDRLVEYIRSEANVADAAVRPTTPVQPTRPVNISQPTPPTPVTPVISGVNLLTNANYEQGVTLNWHGLMDLTVPNNWDMVWREGNEGRLPNQSDQFYRPRSDFGQWGEAENVPCLRMYGQWRPIWWEMKQGVNVNAGGSYRFSVRVFPAPVTGYAGDGSIIYAPAADSCEARLVARSGGQEFVTQWRDGTTIPFGKFTTLTLDFTAPGTQAEVAVEVRQRYGNFQNGCIIGALKLEGAAAATPSISTPSVPSSAGALALKNGDFSSGVTYYKDQRSIEVPEGWTFWCADESIPKKGPESFKYPRANIITPQNTSPDDLDGLAGVPRAYRVVGNWRAIWFSMSQDMRGLTSGKQYRFTARVMPDPVDRYEGVNNDKVFVADPDGGELWLKVVSGGQQTLTLKRVNADYQPGSYVDFTHDFTASGDAATVTLEVRARFPLTQNAWYIAALAVSEAGAGTAPATATPTAATGGYGGKRGITGSLRLFVPDKFKYASGIENIKFYEEIQNQTSARKTYGVLGIEILNKDTGEKKFHTSFSGEMILGPNCKGPQDTCGGEVLDQMVLEQAGNYRLSLQICHSTLNDCMSGKGDWEQLSPDIDIVVDNWQPGQTGRTDAAPSNFKSRGVVCNEFWIENTEAHLHGDIWFNFKVTNTTDQEVRFSILAARTETGWSAGSWTNEKLGPHQVLEWKDHINLHDIGLHNVFMGIWYDGVENGMRRDAVWDRLSNSIQVNVIP